MKPGRRGRISRAARLATDQQKTLSKNKWQETLQPSSLGPCWPCRQVAISGEEKWPKMRSKTCRVRPLPKTTHTRKQHAEPLAPKSHARHELVGAVGGGRLHQRTRIKRDLADTSCSACSDGLFNAARASTPHTSTVASPRTRASSTGSSQGASHCTRAGGTGRSTRAPGLQCREHTGLAVPGAHQAGSAGRTRRQLTPPELVAPGAPQTTDAGQD